MGHLNNPATLTRLRGSTVHTLRNDTEQQNCYNIMLFCEVSCCAGWMVWRYSAPHPLTNSVKMGQFLRLCYFRTNIFSFWHLPQSPIGCNRWLSWECDSLISLAQVTGHDTLEVACPITYHHKHEWGPLTTKVVYPTEYFDPLTLVWSHISDFDL